MKRILYANGSVLTGDDIATSVVRYATALARAKTADTVRIPIMRDDRQSTVEMLIGPSSQLIIEDAGEGRIADSEVFLDELETKRDRIEHPPPITSGEPDFAPRNFEEY
jgi:hypothetical protein